MRGGYGRGNLSPKLNTLFYIAAVRQAHVIRGLEAPALAEGAIKAALKGLRNRESLGEDSHMAVMTRELMWQAKKFKMSSDRKRTIWSVLCSLFMGSFRGSELLGYDPRKYDPTKTLCNYYIGQSTRGGGQNTAAQA